MSRGRTEFQALLVPYWRVGDFDLGIIIPHATSTWTKYWGAVPPCGGGPANSLFACVHVFARFNAVL
jgi:hypothetical protein